MSVIRQFSLKFIADAAATIVATSTVIFVIVVYISRHHRCHCYVYQKPTVNPQPNSIEKICKNFLSHHLCMRFIQLDNRKFK